MTTKVGLMPVVKGGGFDCELANNGSGTMAPRAMRRSAQRTVRGSILGALLWGEVLGMNAYLSRRSGSIVAQIRRGRRIHRQHLAHSEKQSVKSGPNSKGTAGYQSA